ncbi:hypothetical protein CYMTET_10290 [Cymbomonas tetramitiformis]|uniref:Uncharacterized protein n=1 Tax=Cymbomonas tetramitiformis TaxID=36881 RepID=A0AAE0GPU1_9CHLO|nr:hypothetical protein CYMTET_10290 [Cymbomonas tetramitiformis]
MRGNASGAACAPRPTRDIAEAMRVHASGNVRTTDEIIAAEGISMDPALEDARIIIVGGSSAAEGESRWKQTRASRSQPWAVLPSKAALGPKVSSKIHTARSRLSIKMYSNPDFTVPESVTKLGQEEGQSVNLRFFTSSRRGSGISEPWVGARVALLTDDGRCSLHTIPRVEGESTSASRFESGSDVAAIWVAPELGTWRLTEVEVTQADGTKVRFPCSEMLGDDDNAAAELRPETSVPLSPEERAQLFNEGIQDYAEMKQQILVTNIGLVFAGSAAAWGYGGIDCAEALLTGGALGLAYSYLLQRQVDTVGTNNDGVLGSTAASFPARLLVVFLGASAAIQAFSTAEPSGAASTSPTALVFLGALGFFMYKISIVYAASTRATFD